MTNEQKLKYAVALLSIDLVVGLLAAIISPYYFHYAAANSFISKFLFPLVDALIFGFLIWQIALKQNWARIVSLIIFIVLLAITVFSIAFSHPITVMTESISDYTAPQQAIMVFAFVIPAIRRVLEAVALFFLFTKSMNVMFQQQKQ